MSKNVLDYKTKGAMQKALLNYLNTNKDYFAPKTLTIYKNKVNTEGVGMVQLKKLYKELNNVLEISKSQINEIEQPKITKKKVKEMKDKTVFNTAFNILNPSEIFESSVKKVRYGNNDVIISAVKFNNVSEARELKINHEVEEKEMKVQDLKVFMTGLKGVVKNQMRELFNKFQSYKVVFNLEIQFTTPVSDKVVVSGFSSASSLGGTGVIINNVNDINQAYLNALERIIELIDNYMNLGSGWTIDKILKLFIKATKYEAFVGASYIELPENLKNKKCCINVKNDDNKCFDYAFLSGVYCDEIKKDAQRVSKYVDYMDKINRDGITYPVSSNDYEKYELQNGYPINVFKWNNDVKEDETNFDLLYVHKLHNEKKVINIVLIEDEDKFHYCWIKSIRAFVRRQTSEMHLCDKCMRYFALESAYTNHFKKNQCIAFSGKALKELPEEGKQYISFDKQYKQLDVPFVIYADLESVLVPVSDNDKNVYQNHQVSHIGCKLVSRYPQYLKDEYKEFTGKDAMTQFILYCLEMEKKGSYIVKYYDKKMIISDEQETNFLKSTHCHICSKKYKDDDIKVRDHDHITGLFRGSAHQQCNLEYKYKQYRMPVIFHNLRGYDSHFIIQYIAKLKEQDKNRKLDISVIPNTMEKYLSFSINKCVFLDSLQFTGASLESLVCALNKSNDEFKYFNEGLNNYDAEARKLIRKKGIFPYDWFDNLNKLNHIGLPEQKDFDNKLNESVISDEDYKHALNVYDKTNCKNFGDYMKLYLKTDVLLLADAFEAYRRDCKKNFGLDPCHFFTAPGLSWAAWLKMTGAVVECFKEGQEDMLEMVQSGMRGGISMISTRYAKANNKYMKDFDEKEEISYIIYNDANNLYATSMVKYLPTGDYSWTHVEDNKFISWLMSQKAEQKVGFIIELDLKIPEHLHDYFNDYPIAPETCFGEYSTKMNEIKKICGIKEGVQVKKLCPNLRDKTNYVCHYQNLQYYLTLGAEVIKVHRILSFSQAPIMKEYIDFNTKRRAETKNEFEKDLFKLMNNSIFGKTMENVEKRIDVKLFSDAKKFVKQASKPHFKDSKIFSEGLVACEMSKTTVKYDKPMIIGFCILELSKLHMYKFHYDYIKNKYGDKAKLLFTDTDSLCYHIKTDDIYEDMKNDSDLFDTSDYPKNHPLYSEVNKKVIGKFKDETHGKPIIEFCGLRSKMYTFLTEEKGKSVAKGIKRNQIKKLKMENYKDCIFGDRKEQLQQKVKFNLIQSRNHQVNSVIVDKIGLCGIDEKRWVLDNNIDTLSHGHFRIKEISKTI
jgi:hypothetical protein